MIKEPTARLLAKVNAAGVMARAADLGQPELADSLVEVLKVPELSDGVRLYALRGLRELLAQNPPVLDKERLPAVVAADRGGRGKPGFNPNVTAPEEVDGFRYVRREAVRALALVKDPSAAGPGKPALTLLRVVAADGLTPEPRVDERLEAATGLAHMRHGEGRQELPARLRGLPDRPDARRLLGGRAEGPAGKGRGGRPSGGRDRGPP